MTGRKVRLMKRRQLIAALALGLWTLALFGAALGVWTAQTAQAALPTQARALSLKVSVGYNGVYRPGAWLPVYAELRNNTDTAWEGYVQARTTASGARGDTVYRVPVALAPSAHKRLTFYISLERIVPRLEVEAVARDGQKVASASAGMQAINEGDALYAVVTESVYGAVDLTTRPLGAGQAYQVNWQPQAFPDRAEALRALDVILLHDVDSGTWSPQQLAALRAWVLAGGHLIVAGGDAWPRTAAELDDLLPAQPQGSRVLEDATVFGAYVRHPSQALDEALTVAVSAPQTGARVLLSAEDVPLIVRRRYGSGWVDFFAADPQAAPFRAWSDFGELWYTLIVSVGPRPAWARGFGDWNMGREAALSFRTSALPSVRQLCGFLTLYVIVVGPLNYLVLKRLKRREWAWFTVPAIVLFFSGVAYTVGFELWGNATTLNQMAVVRAWPQHPTAQTQELIGILAPRAQTYTLGAPEGSMLRALPEYGSGADAPLTVTEGAQFVAEDIYLGGGRAAHLALSGPSDAPSLQAKATWTLVPDAPPRVSGSIINTNDFPLYDAVLLVKGEARALGTLFPGQTASFDVQIGPQNAAPLLLGSGDLPQNQVGGAAIAFTQGVSWCFYPRGLAVTVLDVMQGQSFPCYEPQNAHERILQRRYRLLAAYVVDSETSGGRGDGVYLFAWGQTAPLDVSLNHSAEREATTLYIFELPVTVTAPGPGATVRVPPAMTYWVLALTDAPSTLRYARPDQSFQLEPGDQAVFQFFTMPRMRLERVQTLDLSLQIQGEVRVELWDWEAGRWVTMEIDEQASAIHVTEAARFVGAENAVRVRLSASNALTYNQVNYVGVMYKGWLEAPTSPASDE